MIMLNYVLLILLGFAFIALMAGFFLLIAQNMRQGRVFRRNVAQHIETLRMGKMLGALGIDTSAYLHDLPMHQVNAEVKLCQSCENTGTCDDKLQNDSLTPDDVDFCPNQQSLASYKQALNSNSDP